MVKNPPANAGASGDTGSVLGLGRSPGEGNGNSLQYSCLENSMDKGVWWAIALGVSESETWKLTLSLSLHFRAMEDGFIF